MDFIYLGKIVNTHGIKGEVRILSDFRYKENVFKHGFKVYIGINKIEKIINTYRVHKNYDMITFEGINNINDVLEYKGEKVYIKRSELNIDGILDEDLIDMSVYSNNNFKGIVKELLKSKAHDILSIENEEHKYLIPYIPEFIENIDLNNKRIDIKEIGGLFDEN